MKQRSPQGAGYNASISPRVKAVVFTFVAIDDRSNL
jgi:hypothetical protein